MSAQQRILLAKPVMVYTACAGRRTAWANSWASSPSGARPARAAMCPSCHRQKRRRCASRSAAALLWCSRRALAVAFAVVRFARAACQVHHAVLTGQLAVDHHSGRAERHSARVQGALPARCPVDTAVGDLAHSACSSWTSTAATVPYHMSKVSAEYITDNQGP